LSKKEVWEIIFAWRDVLKYVEKSSQVPMTKIRIKGVLTGSRNFKLEPLFVQTSNYGRTNKNKI